MTATPGRARTVLLTGLALLAFAANSILCRLALGQGQIDAASFTTVRLVSGALALGLIVAVRQGLAGSGGPTRERPIGDWFAAAMLFLYAAAFSFAYLTLEAGTGALILFGAVQTTMIIAALVRGERPGSVEWLGLLLAIGGLAYLVSPGWSAPSPLGSGLMALAGMAWGGYTLRGGGASDALLRTRDNFVRALPWALVLSVVAGSRLELSGSGLFWASLSGAVTSGAGYAIWYAALRGLSATRAAIVQLSVPLLAAAAGIVLLGELPSWRLGVAATLILGGVGLALTSRAAPSPAKA